MLKLFRRSVTDEVIFKQLGGMAYIRNGVGFGFISDQELYDNRWLEVGFGRTTSGYGDWGGGFSQATTSPLKLVIDRDFNIIKSSTDSFYNSPESKRVEQIAEKLRKRLGKRLLIKNSILHKCVISIFGVLPTKNHIGLDIELKYSSNTLNMLDYFVREAEKIKNAEAWAGPVLPDDDKTNEIREDLLTLMDDSIGWNFRIKGGGNVTDKIIWVDKEKRMVIGKDHKVHIDWVELLGKDAA